MFTFKIILYKHCFISFSKSYIFTEDLKLNKQIFAVIFCYDVTRYKAITTVKYVTSGVIYSV